MSRKSSSASELLAEGGPSPTLRAAIAATNRKAPPHMRDPKKGGGGSGSWGVPGDELNAVGVLDPKDPNFDKDEEPFLLDTYQPKLTGSRYKTRVVEEVDHFLEGEDVKETCKTLEAISEPLYRYYIVSKMLHRGLPAARQRVQEFLIYASSPAIDVLSQEQLERGLQDSFELVEDWELDAPGTRESLVELTAALEANDHVTSNYQVHQLGFVKRRPALKYCFNEVLDELFAESNIDEVLTHVQNVRCDPFLSHAIKLLLRRAVAGSLKEKELAVRTLCALQERGLVSRLQTMRGVELVLRETDDILLDLPKGVPLLGEVVARCVVDECIPPSLLENLFSIPQNDAALGAVDHALSLLAQPGAAEAIVLLWDTPQPQE